MLLSFSTHYRDSSLGKNSISLLLSVQVPPGLVLTDDCTILNEIEILLQDLMTLIGYFSQILFYSDPLILHLQMF